MSSTSKAFPVVGIGASAGGLDACKEFFEFLPANTGMAFVLVQHLDPHHKSMLTELLFPPALRAYRFMRWSMGCG